MNSMAAAVVIVEPTLYSREGEIDALHGSQQAMIDGLIYH